MKRAGRTTLLLGLAVALLPAGASAAAPSAELRVNQVGYAPDAAKAALLMTSAPAGGARVEVVGSTGRSVLRLRLGRDHGRWNRRFGHVYAVNLSGLRRPGRFRLRARVAGRVVVSPRFAVAAAPLLYAPLAADALSFFRTQRDGPGVPPGPLHRQPSHLADLAATAYLPPGYDRGGVRLPLRALGGPENVAGGWLDAGDDLKFVETASFADVLIEISALRYPQAPSTAPAIAEARWGTDWLLAMWHQDSGTLDGQVGLGDGRGNVLLGDHDLWRLPQADDRLRVGPGSPTYYDRYRPVLRFANAGEPISPNLAGRLAAAFGLCSRLFRVSDPAYADRCLLAGQTVFDRARTNGVGGLQTTDPVAYYPETSWRDDMGLGATELYLATAQAGAAPLAHRDPRFYLGPATAYAAAEMTSAAGGNDSLTLYDTAPLLDVEVAQVLVDDERRHPGDTNYYAIQLPNVIDDLGGQLRVLERRARVDPFGLADLNGRSDSVGHALGVAAMAGFYDELTASRRFAGLEGTERGWVLGANAWGSSFIIGAGTTFPHCPQHQAANLAGSLNGRGAILLGGTVDGPTDLAALSGLGLPDGARRCPASGRAPFAAFNGRGSGYVDSALSSATSEPSDDLGAMALLAFSQGAGGN